MSDLTIPADLRVEFDYGTSYITPGGRTLGERHLVTRAFLRDRGTNRLRGLGMSMHKPVETFNDEMGRRIALGRALKNRS